MWSVGCSIVVQYLYGLSDSVIVLPACLWFCLREVVFGARDTLARQLCGGPNSLGRVEGRYTLLSRDTPTPTPAPWTCLVCLHNFAVDLSFFASGASPQACCVLGDLEYMEAHLDSVGEGLTSEAHPHSERR